MKSREFTLVKDITTVQNALILLNHSNCCQTSKLNSKRTTCINKVERLIIELKSKLTIEF